MKPRGLKEILAAFSSQIATGVVVALMVAFVGAILVANGTDDLFGEGFAWEKNLFEGNQAFEASSYQVAVGDDTGNSVHEDESGDASEESATHEGDGSRSNGSIGAVAGTALPSTGGSTVGDGTVIVPGGGDGSPAYNPSGPSQGDSGPNANLPSNPGSDEPSNPGEDKPGGNNPGGSHPGNGGSGQIPGTGPGEENPGSDTPDEPSGPRTPSRDDLSNLDERERYVDPHGYSLVGIQVTDPSGAPLNNWTLLYAAKFDPADVLVRATFEKPGTTGKTVVLGYGGKDGYSVSLNTKLGSTADEKEKLSTAVFSYHEASFSVQYKLLLGKVVVSYAVTTNPDDEVDASQKEFFFKTYPTLVGDAIGANLGSLTNQFPTSKGNTDDLSDTFRVMIAQLGDSDICAKVQDALLEAGGSQNQNLVTISSNGDTLKTMFEGFKAVESNRITDAGSPAVVYAPKSWYGANSAKVIAVPKMVPSGYTVKRVCEGSPADASYRADQVLTACSISGTEAFVPQGVTKVALGSVNANVHVLHIPESVLAIDVKSIQVSLPNLESVVVDPANRLFSSYAVTADASMLYSHDGNTLLLAPANIPSISVDSWNPNATSIGEHAFLGSKAVAVNVPGSISSVQKDAFADSCIGTIMLHGTVPFDGAGECGIGSLAATDVVSIASRFDVACKNWIMAFEGKVDVTSDRDGSIAAVAPGTYKYVKDPASGTRMVVLASDETVLAGVDYDIPSRHISVPDSVRSLAAGAFSTAANAYDITVTKAVTEWRELCLCGLPPTLRTINLTGPCPEYPGSIDPNAFGTASDPKEPLPNVKFFVPSAYFDAYSRVFADIFGSAANDILEMSDAAYWYYDNAKYQVLSGDVDGFHPQSASAADLKAQSATTPAAPRFKLIEVFPAGQTYFEPVAGTVSIADRAFSGCSTLEIVHVPEYVTEIAATAFDGCDALRALALDNANVKLAHLSGVDVYVATRGATNAYDVESGVLYRSTDNGKTYALVASPSDVCRLTVPANVTEIGYRAFSGNTALTSFDDLEFESPQALKRISASAFEGCTSLEDVDGAKLTSLATIGDHAFAGCESLGDIDFPNVTYIGASAFEGCASIVKIEIPKIASLGEAAFKYCTSLYYVTLPNLTSVSSECFYGCSGLYRFEGFETGKVKSIGDRAFAFCTYLYTVGYDWGSKESIDLAPMTSIGEQAFYGCTHLNWVYLPSTLTNLGAEAFRDCKNLETVMLNGWLTSISRYCFQGCVRLNDFRLNGTQPASLLVIGTQAFAQCESMGHFDFGSCTNLTRIGARAFEDCTMLSQAVLPKNLNDVPYACFAGCTQLSMVEMRAEVPPAIDPHAFGNVPASSLRMLSMGVASKSILNAYYKAYSPVLDADSSYGKGFTGRLLAVKNPLYEMLRGVVYERKSVDGSWTITGSDPEIVSGELVIEKRVESIADLAFQNCTGLVSVTLEDDSVISLGNRCFEGCTGLVTVYLNGDIPSWGDYVFANLSSISAITVTNSSTDEVARIGTGAFMNCTGITGSNVTMKGKIGVIGKAAFKGCSGITQFNYTTTTLGSVTEVEDEAFRGCASMTRSFVYTNASFKVLKKIGKWAFAECNSVVNQYVPAVVESIGEGCYMDCENLGTVSFYGALDTYPKDAFKNCPKLRKTGGVAAAFTGLKNIGEGAYDGCIALDTLASGESDTWDVDRYVNLETIGLNAFRGCKWLSVKKLPATLRSIGAGSFNGCSSFAEVRFEGSVPPAFGYWDITGMDELAIKVPEGSEQAYLAALTPAVGKIEAMRLLGLADPDPSANGAAGGTSSSKQAASAAVGPQDSINSYRDGDDGKALAGAESKQDGESVDTPDESQPVDAPDDAVDSTVPEGAATDQAQDGNEADEAPQPGQGDEGSSDERPSFADLTEPEVAEEEVDDPDQPDDDQTDESQADDGEPINAELSDVKGNAE